MLKNKISVLQQKKKLFESNPYKNHRALCKLFVYLDYGNYNVSIIIVTVADIYCGGSWD